MGHASSIGRVLRPIVFLALGCLALGSVMPAAAAEPEPPGRQLYVRYCGACHGPQGKGDGIASSFMRPSPADLTLLAKRHGGEFPLDLVTKAIDGREMPRVHGDPWMPVWGTVLGERQAEAGKPQDVVEDAVRGRIMEIAQYLRTIQAR